MTARFCLIEKADMAALTILPVLAIMLISVTYMP